MGIGGMKGNRLTRPNEGELDDERAKNASVLESG